MPTEKILVKTKDNCVIAFDITYQNAAEKARLVYECENLCKDVIYRGRRNSFTYSSEIDLDVKNTDFLNKEISGYHFRKDRANFSNGMQDDPPTDEPNTLYLSHRMTEEEFPEILKNLGFKVIPTDKSYDVRYNRATGQFETSPEYETQMALVNSDNKSLSIVRNHFHFSASDYMRLQELRAQFETHRRANKYLKETEFAQNSLTDQRDRALFWFYGQEVERNQHRDSLLSHEAKHVKNSAFDGGLSLKNNHKRLSVENNYRLAVEDERSAYLEQLVNDVNKYLHNGDMNDYSMFDNENNVIVEHLKTLRTDAEKLSYVTNWSRLVAEKIADFESRHRSYYDYGQEGLSPILDEDGDNTNRQFLINTKQRINEAPLNVPEDVDGSEFRKLRSLYYNYKIYNPTTHHTESVNLSRYITPDFEVVISPEIQRNVIDMQKRRLEQRMAKFASDKARGLIDVSLIAEAKRLMRDNAANHAFVTEIDNFRISSLYDGEDLPPPPFAPSPSVPNNNAYWSDDLQRYWQQVEGYSEVAKNNEEFRFKIKDATVRYTNKKQVDISGNADYLVYDKMLKEPSNRSAPIEFLDTLSQKQKLLLYIACVNNGRRMKGAVPTDLSGIARLNGVPEAEMNKFRHRLETINPASQSTHQQHRLQSGEILLRQQTARIKGKQGR